MNGTAFSDNMDHTCNNWTSSSTGGAQVGHFRSHGSDRHGTGEIMEQLPPEQRMQPGESGQHGRGGIVLLLRGELATGTK